ncbi:MAG: flavodoxin family protein [Candidatus Adiutrix sp.]|jgi:multimeric flavodoxin WrbA|nr:flavodoxin family protein [Candidatus Adiutrix sp.]
MKVLLVNGSPHTHGCTFTALSEIAATLEKEGVTAEIFQLGTKALPGCISCGKCGELGKCVFDDQVNVFTDAAAKADGFVFGSPVHYAAAGGAITSFLDRVFFSTMNAGRRENFYLKPAAAVVSARRGGTTAALDQLNKYFTISEMPVISSKYWNMVHGFTPEDVKKDLEGLQVMRVLGRNMAWFLKCKEAGQKAGVSLPATEKSVMTNFID